MDEKDKDILQVLARNARSSARQIAEKTGLAPVTVINRMKNMSKAGIIKGFTVHVDPEKLGYTICVLIDVRVSKGKLLDVEKKIAADSHVMAVYDVTGDFDATILARFHNRNELDSFVKRVQKIDHVERTYTKLVLNTIKENGTVV
jgi:DNA-binding Lrp family transcriptional regulator